MFKKINGGSSVLKATAKNVETNSIEFMVNTAIMSLDNPRGSSVGAIIKEVSKMYDIDGEATSMAIKRYIDHNHHKLVQTQGSGLEGKFKLSREASIQLERQIKATKATMTKAAGGSKKIAAVKNAPTKTKTAEKATPVMEPTKDPEIGPMKPVPKKTVSSAPATASTSSASKTFQLGRGSWITREDSEDSDVSWRDWNGGKNTATPDAITKNVGDNQNCVCYQTGGKLIEKSSAESPRFKIERREIITSVVLDGRSMKSMKSLHQLF